MLGGSGPAHSRLRRGVAVLRARGLRSEHGATPSRASRVASPARAGLRLEARPPAVRLSPPGFPGCPQPQAEPRPSLSTGRNWIDPLAGRRGCAGLREAGPGFPLLPGVPVPQRRSRKPETRNDCALPARCLLPSSKVKTNPNSTVHARGPRVKLSCYGSLVLFLKYQVIFKRKVLLTYPSLGRPLSLYLIYPLGIQQEDSGGGPIPCLAALGDRPPWGAEEGGERGIAQPS